MSEHNTTPVKVLIVDDAPLMRKAIQQIMNNNGGIEVVGTAANGQECLDKIRELKPDVITLDIDMPVMNGITAIKNIMVRHQTPVVIVSSLVQDGYFAFEALRLGVVDFVPKPSRMVAESWGDEDDLLRMRVRLASNMQIHRMRRVRRRKRAAQSAVTPEGRPCAVVAMGTTLAGPNTIMHIVTRLSPDFPGAIVALQEIHPKILAPFCATFNEISPLEIVPVMDTCSLQPGKLYLASTFRGLRIEEESSFDGLVLNPNGPAEYPINQLFESAAEHFGDNTCGVLLTGVGTDGGEGMRAIQGRAGLTIGQDQECSVYPNLVQHAIEMNAVDVVMSNQAIADRLESWIQGKRDFELQSIVLSGQASMDIGQ